jgi:thioredoxin reductase (NADPH)
MPGCGPEEVRLMSIVIYTRDSCSYCAMAKQLLQSKGVEWTEINIEAEAGRRDEMIERSGRMMVPQIFIGETHVGGFNELSAMESAGELDPLLGRARDPVEKAGEVAEHRRVIIVGSGPAGYTAAIYAARAELEPLVIAGLQFGGQLMLTTDVENYPGFPQGVTGPEMMELFQKQAERFGTEIIRDDVSVVDCSARPFGVKTADRSFTADAVILAMGASAKWLGIDSEQRLMNKGVSACATCDGALFRGKPMAVVGGGDTALEEALFLARFATKVFVIHRRDSLRGSKIMQERALDHEKIEFVWDSVVDEVVGEEFVTGVRTRNVKTDQIQELAVEAVFIAIGHEPNTKLVRDQIDLNSVGYITVAPGSSRTNIEGVFACGDAMDPVYRQAVTAAGTGCMAAIDAERWLAEQGVG